MLEYKSDIRNYRSNEGDDVNNRRTEKNRDGRKDVNGNGKN